jgi:hypothetical protein
MKTGLIILGLGTIGLAYLYFSSPQGSPRPENPYEKKTDGKIIFTDTTETTVDESVNKPVSLPQPPDINIILPKGN